MEIIDRKTNSSDPEKVLEALDEFAAKYQIGEADELWMVIDRDYRSWIEKQISYVAQRCHQKKGYRLGLSNPAFELWLLLHLKDISEYPQEKQNELFRNPKGVL